MAKPGSDGGEQKQRRQPTPRSDSNDCFGLDRTDANVGAAGTRHSARTRLRMIDGAFVGKRHEMPIGCIMFRHSKRTENEPTDDRCPQLHKSEPERITG